MRSRSWLFGLLLGLALCSHPATQAAGCDPKGNIKFICGPVNPEDLVAVPGGHWVLASGLNGGAIHVIHVRDQTTTQVFPSPQAKVRHDTRTYSACPGPVDAKENEKFSAHGLNVREGRGGLHTVYLVHHGFRESIEVFEIDANAKAPFLTWIGCVVAPENVALNAVAPLPGEGFLATNPYNRSIPNARDRAGKGEASGEIREWHADRGWSIVPGSETPGPNGLEVSKDGNWMYVNMWPAKKMMRISRGQNPTKKDVIDLPFHPDNIRWQADGTLLSAGHDAPTMERATQCLRVTCHDAAAKVARWDPRTLQVQQVVNYPSDDVFFGATAALQVGKEIWLGSVRGDRIARVPVP